MLHTPWLAKVVQKWKMGETDAFICYKTEPKLQSANRMALTHQIHVIGQDIRGLAVITLTPSSPSLPFSDVLCDPTDPI